MEETKATLYRTKLGELSKNSPEKIFEFNGIGASIARLSAYGNKLFFNTSSYSDLQGNGYETYIYFDNLQSIIVGNSKENDRKIFVYDKSGKYVTEITPKNPKDDCYFGGDDMMIFKENIDGETVESDGAKGYYVLDKSQLKFPDKQFIDME